MSTPRPFTQIPDSIDPNVVGRYLRMVQDDFASAIAAVQNTIPVEDKATRRKLVASAGTRVASALYALETNVTLDKARMGINGDVLFLIDGGRSAVWGSLANLGPGGTSPSVGKNNLLDGVYHLDTLATTVARGKMIVGNATPKWAGLAIGANGTSLVSNGTDPSWGTPVSGGGWTDDGTTVRLTTATDIVSIGTATGIGRFLVLNAGATTDVVATIKAIAAQSGNMLNVLTSAGRNSFSVGPTGNLFLGNTTDNGNVIVVMGAASNVTQGYAGGPTHSIITWLDTGNNLSDPTCTADMIGCAGARFYPYKDGNGAGTFDMAYGQSATAAWVLVSDESIGYEFWTGGAVGSVTPFLRCRWEGNGDLANYGKIRSRKSLGAASKGIPGIELERTGAGTQVIQLRAPATVAADRTQLLQDLNATVVMVGDKAPTVGSRQMGKIDSTGLSAAVASVNLTNGAAAGVYRVSYALTVTTLDATSGTIQFQVNFTDVLGATNQSGATLALTVTGRQTGSFVVQLTSGEISYQTNLVTVGGGAERYALFVRVEALG